MDVNEITVAEDSSDGAPMEIAEAVIVEQAKEKSLLQSVLDSKLKHEDLVRECLEKYLKNPIAALVDILQFVVEASGSQYQIPKDTVRPFVYRDIIQASTEQYRAVSQHYPLIIKNSAETFERNVGGFVQCLLKLADGTPIISDHVFLFEVTGFVMACAESNVRPIRHTSVLIGLKMMTALNDLPNVAGGNGPLKRLWMRMFDCLFVGRQTDVVTGIRLLCLKELGHWMRKYPEGGLQAHSLRYFYEGLKDNFGDVRKFCLERIKELTAGNEELRPLCQELGREFRDRLLLLCVDRESEVGEDALRILTGLYESSPTILSDVDCRVLEQLMLAANRGLSQAAGEFFMLRCMEPQREVSPSQVVKRLLDFFIGYGQHEHASYLVDALIDSCDLILDWETMVGMLMNDDSETRLSPEESSVLIEILSRGVKQAITGEIPQGRYTKDLARNPKPGAQLRATLILAPILSELLLNHVSFVADMENLLELPQHLYLDYFLESSNTDQLQVLLGHIKEIMLKQSFTSVLRIGALTLEYLNEIPDTKPHLEELLNSAVANYKLAHRTWQQMYGISPASSRASSQDSHSGPRRRSRSLLRSLRLISALYRNFDLSGYHLTESVLSSLKRVFRDHGQVLSRDDLPAEAILQYIEVCYFTLNWDLVSVKKEDVNRTDLEMEESCAALRKHLNEYLNVTIHFVATAERCLGYFSFVVTCDLYLLFGDPLLQSPSSFVRSVRYKPSVREFDALDNFVLLHIFECSAQVLISDAFFDELHRRREILTGYFKLLAFNVIPSMRACKILRYYDKYYVPFGDLMRTSLERALDINPVNYGMTILHTCLLPFKAIMNDVNHDGVRAMSTLEFPQLLSLARRLGEIFNRDLLKSRQGVYALHRAGICYVMESMSDVPIAPPKYVLFLSVLKEFVPQLLHQDRASVSKYLQRIEQPALPSVNRVEWQPLEEYRASLVTRS